MIVCDRCQAQIERGDIRCAVCAQSVPLHEQRIAEPAALKVLRCTGCGAATSWSAEKAALNCGFCDAVTKPEEIEDPVEQTERYVPFEVDAAAAKAAMTAWQKSLGFFRPGDLVARSTVHELKPIFWPAWIFDARADVTWAADSNAGAGRSAWAPHAGRLTLSFDQVIVGASRGLAADEMRRLDQFSLARAGAEQPQMAGAVFESFDVQRSAAREQVTDACSAIAAGVVEKGHIPGNRFRKLKVSLVLTGLTTHRVALPSWVMAYRYKSKLYRVVVHGQRRDVVLGDAPLSIWRILAVVLGAVAVLALIAVVIALVRR
jgi:hypothetical protein